MNPNTPQLLMQKALPAASALLYTPPTGQGNVWTEISSIWLCNTDVAIRALTLRYGNGTLTVLNSLFDVAPIEPKRTYIIFDGSPIKMRVGDQFFGFCDVADKIVLSIWGAVWQG